MLDTLEFKPYNFEEIRGIVHERQRYAFVPDSWDYDALETIIRNTFKTKDIRYCLFLMKNAGEIADSRGADKIEVKDVEKALKKLKEVPKDIGNFA